MEATIKLSGSLSEASTLFQGKYQKSTFELSAYQKELYNRALKGLDSYSYQELKVMTATERREIMSRYARTKSILNEIKQQAITNTVSTLFGKLFPTAKGNSLSLLMFPTKDKFFRAEMSLKDLGISREAIIRKLVAENILSKNDFQCAA